MAKDFKDNYFEFLNISSRCTASISDKSVIVRLKELNKSYPNVVTIDFKNSDGSVIAHFPAELLYIKSPGEILLGN